MSTQQLLCKQETLLCIWNSTSGDQLGDHGVRQVTKNEYSYNKHTVFKPLTWGVPLVEISVHQRYGHATQNLGLMIHSEFYEALNHDSKYLIGWDVVEELAQIIFSTLSLPTYLRHYAPSSQNNKCSWKIDT